jgi:hypothetical protein
VMRLYLNMQYVSVESMEGAGRSGERMVMTLVQDKRTDG